MHGVDLKLGRKYLADKNRVREAETKTRIHPRQQQKYVLNIAAAADFLLYGSGINDSI